MKQTIELPVEWLEKLVDLVDNLCKETDDELVEHGWKSHLLGYVHSLDIYLKDE